MARAAIELYDQKYKYTNFLVMDMKLFYRDSFRAPIIFLVFTLNESNFK